MYSRVYLTMVLIYILIWLVIFLRMPQSRRTILWTSLIFAPTGPICEYWNGVDYWQPQYIINFNLGAWRFGLEDYLMVFAIAGISAGVFEYFMRRYNPKELPNLSKKILLRIIEWDLLCFFLSIGLIYGLKINSIQSMITAGIITALLMLYGNKKIFLTAIFAAALIGLAYWLMLIGILIPLWPEIVQVWWHPSATIATVHGGIPIEEFVWAFGMALLAGPFLRICSGRVKL